MHRCLFLIAGTFILISVTLGYWVHTAWFLFTAFIGLNLVQSAFTNWCPMRTILRHVRVRPCIESENQPKTVSRLRG